MRTTGIERIRRRFDALAGAGRTGLVPYIAAGDPSAAITVELMHALAAADADVIELGVPFSDPSADGPVIQRAAERAIRNGVGLAETIECVRIFRRTDDATPVVLMGYANPFELMAARHGGIAGVAGLLRDAGVDGVLVVDYPPEESVDFATILREAGIATIYMLAPTSTDARIAAAARAASGYLYYVGLKGITGAAGLDVASITQRMPVIRRHADVPVVVGFGIRDAAGAVAVGQVADAVAIGTRIIEAIEQAPQGGVVDAVADFVRDIRTALDAAVTDRTTSSEDRRITT